MSHTPSTPLLPRLLARRAVLVGAAAGATLPLLDRTAAAAAPKVGKVLARGLEVPWGLAFLPHGDALVAERNRGRVHRIDKHGGRTRVGTLPVVTDRGEGGLLGLAVSPTFADDRWVYFYLTTSEDNRVIRAKLTKGSLGPPEVLLTGIGASVIHNGGRIAFGPSGHLFIGTGDNGHDLTAPESESWAQDPDRLEGKILRINADGSVPDDNPFGNPVWSLGHRNVQGLAWDGRGRMWATELGQSARDELNRIRKGRNYGWPVVEGGDGAGRFADPFVTWQPTSTCSPSGVAIARGRAWVGALAGECLWSVRLNGKHKRKKVRHLHGDFGRIRTVEKAPDGSLWITTSNNDGRHTPARHDDRVIRIVV